MQSITRRTLNVFPLLLLVTIAVAQSDRTVQRAPESARNTAQDLTAEQRAKIEQLARLQKHFGKDMSTPGVELSLKEVARPTAGDRTLAKYNLSAHSFPPNTPFTLYHIHLHRSVVHTL